jgi:hypothetical protein
MDVELVVAGVVIRQGSLRQCLATEDRLREIDWLLMEEHRANREAKREFQS